MRLIDVDALMDEFRDFVKSSNNSDFAKVPTWNDAVSLVGSQQTDYDLDKVIEQLEMDEKHTFDGFINKRYAVKIVRKGGING